MQIKKLSAMKGGWFIGDFEPSVLRVKTVEVGCKEYSAGDVEARHVHRVARELTLVVSGRVVMNGVQAGPGDVLVLEPGEAADFNVIERATTVVVKLPSVIGDKYLD